MLDRPSKSMIAKQCLEAVALALPAGWGISCPRQGALTLLAKDGRSSELATVVCRSTQPRTLIDVVEKFARTTSTPLEKILILADFVSPRSQVLLLERGINWVDTVNNLRILSDTPGLFMERQGASSDPWRQSLPLQSLRGLGAGRALRALITSSPPFGLRELALRFQVSAATLSRVIDLLEREALLERSPTGGVEMLNWRGALERWAEDSRGVRASTALACVDPRGLQSLQRNLESTSLPYAATGSFAAQFFAPIAPLRVAALYTPDPIALQRELGLRSADSGANVLLLESSELPSSPDVSQRNGMVLAPLVQIAIDLLSGSGREPAEGKALLDWMEEHQSEWRR